MQPIYKKQEELIKGARDPLPEELSKQEDYEKPIESDKSPDIDLDILKENRGIPDFWLTAMKNDAQINVLIKEHDEPVLKHLVNIRQELLEDNVIN